MVLKWTTSLELLVSGLVVRVEDCYAGIPGSNLPRYSGIFFFLKIQETCTLTSLCVKKLKNFMRVYVNRERAV